MPLADARRQLSEDVVLADRFEEVVADETAGERGDGAGEVEPPDHLGYEALVEAFRAGLIRVTGDIIALSPPLIIERPEIEQVVDLLGGVLKRIA